jgi:LysM repeat protein
MTSAGGTYTVVSGDNLWNISGQSAVYNNPYQWPLIYKANSDQIEDADLIFPGQEFSIPTASGSEIDAAIQHARNRGAWAVGEVEASDREYLAQ